MNPRKNSWAQIVVLIFMGFNLNAALAEEDLPDPLALMEECKKSYEALNDYTAQFEKEQRIRGRLRKPETMFLKFKKPFSIYMKWIKRPDKGKEVIYVKGKNDDKLVGHIGGILGLVSPTFKLAPTNPLAMGGNLKPITQAGLGKTIESLLRIFYLARENGDLKATCKGTQQFNGREVYVVERFLPAKKIYPNQHAIIYIDKELKLPLYYAAYGEEEKLLEKYSYRDLKINVGLTDLDFEKSNPEYSYPIF